MYIKLSFKNKKLQISFGRGVRPRLEERRKKTDTFNILEKRRHLIVEY
jgi:hypothetical protein